MRLFLIAIFSTITITLLAQPPGNSVTANIKGQTYNYQVESFDPPKAIALTDGAGAITDTPEALLTAIFAAMISGDVAGWKNLWEDYRAGMPATMNPGDEKIQAAWRLVMARPHFIHYRITYKDHIIFVTGPADFNPADRGRWLMKQTPRGWRLNRDLMGDELYFYLAEPTFDIRTGKLVPELGALYHFDQLTGARFDDSGPAQLSAQNFGGQLGPGVLNASLALDGQSHVQIPLDSPTTFAQNECTIRLQLYAENIPADSLHRIAPDRYASAVLSRGWPDSMSYLAIQLRTGSGNTNPELWVIADDSSHQSVVHAPFPLHKWTDVEFAFGREKLRLYIDEQLVDEQPGKEVKLNFPISGIWLGRQHGKPPLWYRGKIDELRISSECVR